MGGITAIDETLEVSEKKGGISGTGGIREV